MMGKMWCIKGAFMSTSRLVSIPNMSHSVKGVMASVTRPITSSSVSSAPSSSGSGSSEEDVIFEVEGNKGVITLNRPKQLNALDMSMVGKITPKLKEWDSKGDIKLVILKAKGDKAFCAGGDVKSIALQGPGAPSGLDFFRSEYKLNNTIGSLSMPYISFMDGIVMGGGVGLSVHGSFRVATEKCVFAMPETLIGLFPDVGGSHFLPRLPGKLGIFLALTGHRLEGRDIYKAGIATHFIPSDKLPSLQQDLMHLKDPDLKLVHKCLSKHQEQWESDHRKEFTLKNHIGRINSIFNATSMEAILSQLKADASEWSLQQHNKLVTFSPTSLKVTLKQMQLGGQMSLSDCLRMEYRMVNRFMLGHDFFEGVRAQLIEKDRKPKWSPSRLEDVTNQQVDQYFEKLPPNQELHFSS